MAAASVPVLEVELDYAKPSDQIDFNPFESQVRKEGCF